MLTWDEDVKPASQAPSMAPPPSSLNLGRAVQSSPSFSPAPSLATPPAPVNSASAKGVAAPTPSQGARRVNAADKRIINGQTDVNQLVPFKY